MAIVRAGEQLVREFDGLGVKGKAEVLEEVDGLGFQRQVRLDKAAVDALGDEVVEALGQDDRISEIVRSNQGARVVFVPDAGADFDHPFDLASAVEAASD